MKKITTTLCAALLLAAISCTKEPLRTPAAASAQTQDNAIAPTTGHYIGERFGGGIIFWLDSTGQHGLIAAETDQATTEWDYVAFPYTITGATGKRIGSGPTNTRKIVRALKIQSPYYAAYVCAEYSAGGYTDWFLPSKNELYRLYLKRDLVGGFASIGYWSSTEDGDSKAWEIAFHSGIQYSVMKSFLENVRAIRAF